jgi:hypothetical protein
MRKAIIALSLLAASCAPAVHSPMGAKYDPPPVKSGMVVWFFGTQEEVSTRCKGLPAFTHLSAETQGRMTVNACFIKQGNNCSIVTRAPAVNDLGNMLELQHEVAHCQGWTHPDYDD